MSYADDYIDQLNVLCDDFGCEAGSDRLNWLHERLSDLHTLRAAIFGSDNYDHTLPVSYFVEMLEAERRRKDEALLPYLWQCKDYADGWISYANQDEARAYQRDTGCLLRITYRQPEPRT